MSMEDFHSAHPEPPQDGCIRIDWTKSVGRSTVFRVRSYTCPCLPTSYELGSSGGHMHIRRTERTAKGERVSESPWMAAAVAGKVWTALLEGRAR